MTTLKYLSILLCILLIRTNGFSQHLDSTKPATLFSGKLGLTNNGFSIVPTFSLNAPASLIQLSWKRKKFSIDPDVRMTLDLKKGGIILWFRYYPIEKPNFTLRVGAHPALNFQQRKITDYATGDTSTISQMRRFLAWELAPTWKLGEHVALGLYYLEGHGLQTDAVRTTRFVNLNAGIMNLRLAPRFRLSLYPAVYYLNLDGDDGWYATGTAVLAHTKLPVTLEYSFNQTFRSNIPGNKIFMWNVSANYYFRRVWGRLK